jgi:UDP-N-acetylmuramoyl-L-alanyl-D-glutamate--2,6-diaminopimelate ligase
MDKYLTAKLKLFTDNLLPNGLAVINSAIPECVYIKNFLQQNGIAFLTIGHHKADININILEQSIYSQKINFSYLDKNYDFTTSIIGNFQVTNILIAALLVQKIGYDFEAIIRLLPQINAPTGRLERVTDINHRFHVFVDYAHSADALSNSLMTLRNIIPKQGKLKVVFGCGGDRDKDKRLIMGQIAYRIADEVIITDDNPRSEDPAQIRLDILAGAPLAREIGNREEAIIKSINNLQIGDILLIAGKGHENYQIIGDKRIEFSDIKISKKQL